MVKVLLNFKQVCTYLLLQIFIRSFFQNPCFCYFVHSQKIAWKSIWIIDNSFIKISYVIIV